MNFFESVLQTAFKPDYKFLPMNICPSRILSFTLEGFDSFKITDQDSELYSAVMILRFHLEKLFEIYGKTHIFERPRLFIKPPTNLEKTKIGLKMGMMEKKTYNEFMKRKKKDKITPSTHGFEMGEEKNITKRPHNTVSKDIKVT